MVFTMKGNTIFWFICPFSFQVRTIVKPGCPQEVLKAALSVMASVTEVLAAMSTSSTNSLSALWEEQMEVVFFSKIFRRKVLVSTFYSHGSSCWLEIRVRSDMVHVKVRLYCSQSFGSVFPNWVIFLFFQTIWDCLII